MRYKLEGEDWIPAYQVKKEYNVNSEQLTHAVNKRALRTDVLTNPHNDKEFKVYVLSL